MSREILRIEHLSKCNRSHHVLQSVSFRILSKTRVALLSNPLEKQCLIELLFGNDKPDTGKIYVNEMLSIKNIPEDLQNGGIYYIASKMSLIPDMTVARNFILCLPDLISSLWIRDRALIKKTEELLCEYGLSDISPRERVASLSSSQRLCMEIVIAAQKGARLIVIDDVFDRIGENERRDIGKIIELLYEKNISVLLFANRYNTLFDTFDFLIILQNGVTTAVLTQDKITFHNFIRYYFPTAEQRPSDKTWDKKGTGLTIRNKDLEFSIDRGEIMGIWSLDGDYLMQIGNRKWEMVSEYVETGNEIAVSMSVHGPDKIYKDMSLVDNITYLANDKVSNVLGIMNKRLQQHMAYYSLELIHSEYLMKKYRNQQAMREITQIDQLKVITAKWLCITPQVFVYINPFLALDASTIREFQRILRDLAELKIAVIIISVNREWLELTCDTVISVD